MAEFWSKLRWFYLPKPDPRLLRSIRATYGRLGISTEHLNDRQLCDACERSYD